MEGKDMNEGLRDVHTAASKAAGKDSNPRTMCACVHVTFIRQQVNISK